MLTAARVPWPAPAPTLRSERGFTLLEVIIAIGLLGIVLSVLSLVMAGALRANAETKVRLDETRDEQFAAAYFAGDVAGATAMASGSASRCGAGTAVLELLGASFDSASPPQPTVTLVSYVLTPRTVDGVESGTLTRYACEAPAKSSSYPWTPAVTTVVARTLATTRPTVRCFPGGTAKDCSAKSTTMSVTFERRSGTDPFVLAGTRRTTP